MILNRELIKQDGHLYITIRKIPDRDGLKIESIKESIGAEKAFRNNGQIYFCELIPEVEIVTD